MFLRVSYQFSGIYTYQREPDEECARSWTYRSRESDETSRNRFLPSGQYKSSHRLLSSKLEQQYEYGKDIRTEINVENILYHSVVAVGLFPQSL